MSETLTKCPGGCGYTVIPDAPFACGCVLEVNAPKPRRDPGGLDQFTAWNDAQAALNATYEALHGAWVAERLSDALVRKRRLSEAYRLVTSRLPEVVTKLRKSLGAPTPQKEGEPLHG